MALRLQRDARSRTIQIDGGFELRIDEILPSLARIRLRAAIAGLGTRANECLAIERTIKSGRRPVLRAWLRDELLGIGNGTQPASTKRATASSDKIVATDWLRWCPQAPDSPLLPALPHPLSRDLKTLNVDLDADALLWVRWSCLHRSYLYESIPDSPVSAEALDLLATLGRGWIRMALLDRVRAQRGDYKSNSDVSTTLAADNQVRSSLGRWVTDNEIAHFGRGEAKSLTSGVRSTAPETVAMQILGALTMVTASQAPADGLLELMSFEMQDPEPDWLTVLQSRVKAEPKFTRTETGPDHDKQFTVTVEVNGRSALATAPSFKVARRLAARSYVQRFLPNAIPATRMAPRQTIRAAQFQKTLPHHDRARQWAQQAFEVADPGLMSQALTHRSWVPENRELVERASQRDYGVLATEGSEALTNLVRHHYVLNTLNQTVHVPASSVTSPALPREIVAELFDRMPVTSGVLCSRGMVVSPDIKEDVAQAIVGAAWRANGDLLMNRQPVTVAKWIKAFTPPRDPATLLHEYCARHLKSTYSVDFERRGPQHRLEFRATITFEMDQQLRWRGDWRNSHTAAKHSAADSALNLLLSAPGTQSVNLNEDGHELLREMLLAELRVVDSANINSSKEITSGRLAVDLLAAGRFSEYSAWAQLRSQLLPDSGSTVAHRLTEYYAAVLKQQQRIALRQWAVGCLPTRGVDHPDKAQRLTSWWQGEDCARLALLEDFLSSVIRAGFTNGIVEFIERQAMTVAEVTQLRLESARAFGPEGHTLTLRLAGAELANAINPVADIVDAAFGGATWTRDTQSLSVTVPNTPVAADILSRTGFDAVEHARKDPWLNNVQRQLHEFLVLAERALDNGPDLTSANVDDVLAREGALVTQLRAGG